MKRMTSGVALLLSVAVLAAGCGSRHVHGRPCTLIGCDSALFVALHDKPAGTATIELRSGPRYVLVDRTSDAIQLVLGHRTRGGTVPLALTFHDARNRVLAQVRRQARLRRAQPNGPGCAPVCFQAAFIWARGRLSSR